MTNFVARLYEKFFKYWSEINTDF